MLREIFVMTVSFFGARVLYDVVNSVLSKSKIVRRFIEKDELEREERDKKENASRTIMGFK